MMSENIRKYFDSVEGGMKEAYNIAQLARTKGYDPDPTVSIVLAKDMAERVEGIISVVAPQIKGKGMVSYIKGLETKYSPQDWRVAFELAEEVANEKFCEFKDKKEAIEVGLRVGLAYITNGVVSSPLEGFVKLELKKRKDNQKEYFSLYFSGPIRSAGTTAVCAFIALCDYIRKRTGYASYDPTDEEIKRTITEVDYFHDRITNLQYLPSKEELEFLTKHLTLQINGDPSEKLDVPNYKDLDRIETNKLRNGFCLVMAEGLSQKLKKFWGKFSKWYKDFGMDEWKFVDDFISLQKKIRSGGGVKKEISALITPDYTYIKDIVAGRPVLGYPLKKGSFRLRFGRCRNSGFSAEALHPATLFILNNYIAIGTQLKTERPNKSTVIASCDSIEGPIVRLKDGSVVFLENKQNAKMYIDNIEEILFLGDILINYGDFLVFNHILVPPGYCEEWWALELKKASKLSKDIKSYFNDPFYNKPDFETAYNLSKKYKIPLHPKYTFHWRDLNAEQVLSLIDWMSHSVIKENKIIMPLSYDIKKDLVNIDPKKVLEYLGVPHKVVSNEYIVIDGDWSSALMCNFGCYTNPFSVNNILMKFKKESNGLDIINNISEVVLRDKSGLFIGARMGRPEKAKMRKLIGSPHVLFPVGVEGGRLRSFGDALKNGRITAQFPITYCRICNKETIYGICEVCNNKTDFVYKCKKCGRVNLDCGHGAIKYETKSIDINYYFKKTLEKLNMVDYPALIKGVRGTSNKEHIPEHLAKGVLRAKYDICVNKDGTTRYDMTEMPITHFKPYEVGVSFLKLKELGYGKDIYGEELVGDDQILELKCQDIILPSCPDSIEEGADTILFRVANFVDDLLVNLYGVDRFYNLNNKNDLIGHLILGLSPHTSAGIVCRIIGFSKIQALLAHPLLHSIMRRDCDGDESGVMLLMDAFLNFSRNLLSDHRGATQDEPIVLSTRIIPSEVDDMVFSIDTIDKYPLEFYEACMNYKKPTDVKIETYGERLGKEEQFEGLMFTHPTDDINNGVLCSAYKLIPSMQDKVLGQMAIAEMLRAVDEADVARLIIERHFMRDIKGNLRKFSTQQFRCSSCNEKYRRPPLVGICTKCGGRLIFTVSEGSVVKYLEPSISLAEKYELPNYLRQDLELTKQRVELVFGKEKDKQEGLGRWF